VPILTAPLGPLVIDTAGPVITSASVKASAGRIFINYRDTLSGFVLSSALDPARYTIWRIDGGAPVPVAVTSVIADGPSSVMLTLNGGHRIARGRFLLTISSASITDVAGNALDGEFRGTLPTGTGSSGTDFVGWFAVSDYVATSLLLWRNGGVHIR
jgi:hypothetical protein